MTTTITIRRPDDWHVHLRDGEMLKAVVPYTARHFGRAIIMPNLVPPVTTSASAAAYRDRIMAAVPRGVSFTPLMTAYLTDTTDADDIGAGHRDGVLTAVKLYPAHATTNSSHGVTDIKSVAPVLEAMQRAGMPLLVHGEVTSPDIDIFDREAVFIDRVLTPLLADFPALKVVMEHITTQEAAEFVAANAPRLGATITPQHLMLNRNALFVGGVRPHFYCLPVLKRERHQIALRKAATSGQSCYFLGTDTAPHLRHLKEAACGCAGVFSAPVALGCYAQVFAEENALDRFEAFASLNGPAFYGLPANEDRITLVSGHSNGSAMVPVSKDGELVTFEPIEPITWAVRNATSA
ncbi:dihydroorotase [Flaviflagellibacter deserti]|uniref:Dihydroorotase n=1 Tax=Flaviflagellibacter deserti TaxID=2267266 RepID=A0ABV9YZI9_9HYPH